MLQKQNGYDELTELIIGCGIKVHEQFGPGLFESVYSQCFAIELREAGLQIEITPRIPLVYRGINLEAIFQPDLVIEDTVVVEVKAVERLPLVYHAQVVTYLKLTGCPVGLLMNFNVSYLKDGIRRFVRPDCIGSETAIAVPWTGAPITGRRPTRMHNLRVTDRQENGRKREIKMAPLLPFSCRSSVSECR